MPFTFLSAEDIVSGPGSEWEPQLFLAVWGSRDSGLSCPYKPVTGRWILTGDREQEPTFLPQAVKRVGGKEDYKPHLERVVRRRRWKLTVVNNKCECASHQATKSPSHRAPPSAALSKNVVPGFPRTGEHGPTA